MDQKDDWHLTDALDYEHGQSDPFAAAVRATRMPMVVTNPALADNPIVFVNEAFQRLTGYSRQECVGRNCRFLQGPGTDPGAVAELRAAITEGRDISIDLLNYRKDGKTFWNALYLNAVRDKEGIIRFYFASQLDVTDRVLAQELIARQKAEVDREVARRTADLEAALSAKTLLLNELDHRVKNNLAMIGSILRLQARRGDAQVAGILGTTMARVDALAMVHRSLYSEGDVLHFDLAAFAHNLLTEAAQSAGQGRIRVRAEVTPCEIPSASAATLGLVIGEIVHPLAQTAAARGGDTVLGFSARRDAAGITLVFETPDPDFALDAATADGLGALLVERLSASAGARHVIARPGSGTRLTLTL